MPFCFTLYGAAIMCFWANQQWFFLWLMMELSTINFIGMYFYEKSNSETITLYFLIQSVASFFILFSMIEEEANITELSTKSIFLLGVIMKMGVFPFHNWVPAVASSMKKIMVFLILMIQKIIPFLWVMLIKSPMLAFVFILAILNILWVSPQNLFQVSMKLIIIYSSIAHTSWLLMASLSKYLWEIYFAIYVSIMVFLFMFLNSKVKTLFQKNNRTPLFLIFLTLGGVPPFLGFYPKLMLVFTTMNLKLFLFWVGVLLISLIDLFIYGRLSMMSTVKNKLSTKWQKSNQTMKMFLMLNLIIMGMLFM